jgi:hypothetical protein
MPTDDYSGPAGRLIARQAREALFQDAPLNVRDLMRQAAKERRQQARREWKAKQPAKL